MLFVIFLFFFACVHFSIASRIFFAAWAIPRGSWTLSGPPRRRPASPVRPKRHVGTPHVATVVVKLIIFRNIFDLHKNFGVFFVIFSPHPFLHRNWVCPSAAGVLPDAPEALPRRFWTRSGPPLRRLQSPFWPKRHVGTPHMGKLVVKVGAF